MREVTLYPCVADNTEADAQAALMGWKIEKALARS